MKKNILKVVTVFSFIFALFFVSCTQVHRDITPILDNIDSEEVILEFENYELILFEDIGITSENARDYYLKITYELEDSYYEWWGPGAISDSSWTDLKYLSGKFDSGVLNIEISEIIALADPFRIKWWGNQWGNNLIKCEIVKK